MSIYDIPVSTLAGEESSLGAFAGTTLLVVNVASKCGLTPQYTALEALHERLADRGFSVVGFPCNQFGGQEPGSAEEIAEFCSATYGVTFPMFEKIEVNGPGRHPIYTELTAVPDAGGEAGDIQWNFEKFLVAPGRQRGGAVPADDDARRPRGAQRDRGKPPRRSGPPLPRTAPLSAPGGCLTASIACRGGRDITVHTTRFGPSAHCRAPRQRSNVPGMTTFVLVHGAWGGSYGFRAVRGPLRAAGHDVFTPSLTGIGERVHLASPQVNLTTHVTDVVNTVLYEDLSDIVLLGYSYGGMVVTGSLEYVADRVAHLVYLDAFLPADGQSLNDLTGAGYGTSAIGPGGEWLVPPMARNFDDAAEADWHFARRSPHPVGCFTQPVRLRQPLEEYPFTRTYIKATADARTPEDDRRHPFWQAADRTKTDPAWRYREIDTDHMIPVKRPAELAELLLELT